MKPLNLRSQPCSQRRQFVEHAQRASHARGVANLHGRALPRSWGGRGLGDGRPRGGGVSLA